jgi:hypothetical protein
MANYTISSEPQLLLQQSSGPQLVSMLLPGLFPNYTAIPGFGGGGGGTQAPPATPTPTVTASTVSDLQVLIASIPIAQDGQVITAEYHNNLRAALIAMANRLGLGTISEEITITTPPRLFAMAGGGAWDHDVGVVKKPNDGGGRRGWMELDLPDGARIKRMQVYATTESGNGEMRVKLQRRSVSNPGASDDLVSIDITNNDAATPKPGEVTLPSSTLAEAIEAARIVDNRKYKYVFIAELDNGSGEKKAAINAVQVVLGK